MQRRDILAVGAAGLALMPMAGLLYAQTPPAQAAALADPDKVAILLGSNYALSTSRLAQERAGNEAVRLFAALELAEQEAVAAAFGAIPGEGGLREDHAQTLAALDAAPDTATFDALYVEGQLAGHQELLALHRAYAAGGNDPQARGASMVTVPGIESHMSMLRGIQLQLP